jgi:CheY-like chemotaxis protein
MTKPSRKPPMSSTSASAESRVRHPPLVLLVEDDPEVRQMLETMLRLELYDVVSAENGLEALERMRERLPCAVLLDLMMPVMDGWEFRRRQLQDPALSRVPVVCITAVPNPVEVGEGLGLQCLPKPLDSSRLLFEVQERCGPGGRTGSRSFD